MSFHFALFSNLQLYPSFTGFLAVLKMFASSIVVTSY